MQEVGSGVHQFPYGTSPLVCITPTPNKSATSKLITKYLQFLSVDVGNLERVRDHIRDLSIKWKDNEVDLDQLDTMPSTNSWQNRMVQNVH
jgi:hypothetical protein